MKRMAPIWCADPPGEMTEISDVDAAIAQRYFSASVDSAVYVAKLGPGTLAFDENGRLGIITDSEPNAQGVWLGFNLTDTIGSVWESRNPRSVARVDKGRGSISALTVGGAGTWWWQA